MQKNTNLKDQSPNGACHILSMSVAAQGNIPGKTGLIEGNQPQIVPLPLLVECAGAECPFRLWDARRANCSQRPQSDEEQKANANHIMDAYVSVMKPLIEKTFDPKPSKLHPPHPSTLENLDVG